MIAPDDERNCIYVVTSGEYSDYHIHSVWSDEAKAEEVARILNLCDQQFSPSARVEEYEVNAPYSEREGWLVLISIKNSSIVRSHPICIDESGPHCYENTLMEKGTIRSVHYTVDQALKAAYDKRAEVCAKKYGIS